MDVSRIARSVAIAAVLTGVVVALGGTIFSRWSVWQMLIDADPRAADLPLRVLLLGMPDGAFLEIHPRPGASPMFPPGTTTMVRIDPIWRSATAFAIAGGGQIVGAVLAWVLARRAEYVALGALVACSSIALLAAWPAGQPPDIVSWLTWAGPAAIFTLLCWALAAVLGGRRRARCAQPIPQGGQGS